MACGSTLVRYGPLTQNEPLSGFSRPARGANVPEWESHCEKRASRARIWHDAGKRAMRSAAYLPGNLRRAAILLLGLVLTACVNESVEWGDVSYRQSQLGDPDARSAVMSANLPRTALAESPCIASIRTASGVGELFRAWWSSKRDSSVVLWLQRSEDQGRNWQT